MTNDPASTMPEEQDQDESTDAVQAPTPSYPVQEIELPMCFYLGRQYDLERKELLEESVMYDAKDLTTHGVVVGMTGSGKTGLCVGLLEEAAIDGIPTIIIDPKGDLSNLLLQFPDLSPKSIKEWVNPDEAKQQSMTPAKYAKKISDRWRDGLQDSKQGTERIELLKNSSEWRIYTPGSEAGLPLSILKTFSAPDGSVLREQLNQRIDATATALLGLTGTSSDPVQSREHILIAQLLLNAWSKGENLTLKDIIAQVEDPPLKDIGAFTVEKFYPKKERVKLALALNKILAAPSFSTWIEGEGLDLSRMLYTEDRKPRQLIFYIAHLEESQRIFFVTLLLEEVLNWTRKQTGTSTLRALLYFDEVFGYLPPSPANPPTKLPLMTLLKQARAFGVGVLLATQNPVDLDYKALSNAGTWFIGKLQTERDKARLLEGLESVAAEQGSLTDKRYLDNVISSLGSRVFLLHNVHRGQPLIFKTRHTLSFLSGPMTRDQIAKLMTPLKEERQRPESDAAVSDGKTHVIPKECRACGKETELDWNFCPICGFEFTEGDALRVADEEFKDSLRVGSNDPTELNLPNTPPDLDPAIPHYFLKLASPAWPADSLGLVYTPRLLGVAEVVYAEDVKIGDEKIEIQHVRRYRRLTDAPPLGMAPSWPASEQLENELAAVGVSEGLFEELPEIFESVRNIQKLKKGLLEYVYTSARLVLLKNEKLRLLSDPEEDLLGFQTRCKDRARELAEGEIAKEKTKYQSKFSSLGAKLPDTAAAKPKDDNSLLDFFNPLAWVGPSAEAKAKAEKIAKLENEWFSAQKKILDNWKTIAEEYTTVKIKPKKSKIHVLELGLAWVPYWYLQTSSGIGKFEAYR
ncbi:MAG: helicase HerA domain-containing protein [Gemmataceae bacterium]